MNNFFDTLQHSNVSQLPIVHANIGSFATPNMDSFAAPRLGADLFSWPPSAEHLPIVVGTVVIAWCFILHALHHRRSHDDLVQEQQRLKLAHDRLASVTYEHEQTQKKRTAYTDRKARLEQAAAAHVKTVVAYVDPSDRNSMIRKVYDQMAREAAPSCQDGKASCFAAEQLPAFTSAEHIYDAFVDEISGLPVDQLPGLSTALGTQFATQFAKEVDAVGHLLASRMRETLEKTMGHTSRARETATADPAVQVYATGQKLSQDLQLALKVTKALANRRKRGFLGASLIGAEPPSDEEVAMLSQRGKAKVLLRLIQRQQQGRFLRLITMLSPSTAGYLILAYVTTSLDGVWSTLHTALLSDTAKHAAIPGNGWREAVSRDILAFVLLFVVQWWVNDFVSIVASNRSNADFALKIRRQLFDAIMRQDSAYFEMNDSGAVCDRLNSDCQRMAESFLQLPKDMCRMISRIVATSILLYVRSPAMLYRAAAFAVFASPIIVLMQRAVNQLAHKGHRAMRMQSRVTNEMLRNLSTVREFARESQEGIEYERVQRAQGRDGMKLRMLQHLQWPTFISIFFAGQLMNLWFGAEQVHQAELSAIELIQLFHTFGEVTHSFKHLVDQLPRLLELMLPADRVFALLESRSVIEPNAGDTPLKRFVPVDGGISFEIEGVDFAYPTMPEHRVLRGLTLTIPAGKTVALVGERGCGKSTTVELLKRSYDPEAGCGRVLVNAQPMQSIDVRSFRRHISVVSQSVHLFGGSLKDNILYGLTPDERRERGFDSADDMARESAEKELRRVTEMAGCDFIDDYPLKLETRLGTGGIKLSGGQKQCIAIARALIKRPALLILDEATSALDGKTQSLVAASIRAEQARNGFTIVQIAHRLETLRGSDIVYFFSHGRVVETGGGAKLNRTAVEELLSVPIERKMVEDPESGKLVSRVRSGFFHEMWNKAMGITPPSQMEADQLANKERELRKELAAVEKAWRRKAACKALRIRLIAIAIFVKPAVRSIE